MQITLMEWGIMKTENCILVFDTSFLLLVLDSHQVFAQLLL